MREISPAVGMSVYDYLNLTPEIRPLIMDRKQFGARDCDRQWRWWTAPECSLPNPV